MGVALDEPQGSDVMMQVDGIDLYVDQFARRLDAIKIEYVNHPYFGGFFVRSGNGGCC